MLKVKSISNIVKYMYMNIYYNVSFFIEIKKIIGIRRNVFN